ncbi:NAD-dependent epimerase/dehydratase family protein [Tamlana flava]|uniref:NAD-dependent epimerase/dehydratase family protein n=1 Tax=Tamlana flava TaxID=3158572 RepID=UPI00351B1FDD
MNILITGGGGFLGQAIVCQCLAAGFRIHTFSRKFYDSLNGNGIEQFAGDLSNYEALIKAMYGCDAVIHVAAKTGIQGTYREFFETNVTGTKNILNACNELQIRYLVYTSSASVVYSGDSEGKNEDLLYPEKFDAFYPKTKAIAEKMILDANDHTLVTVALRPHLIWGPEDPHFMPRLLEKRRKNKLWLLGRKKYLVDITYIDNAAKAHLQVLNKMIDEPKSLGGKPYFISQDEPISVQEFIDRLLYCGGLDPVDKRINPIVARFAGWTIQTFYRVFKLKKEPPFDLFIAKQLSSSHWYDISAAKRSFNYFPEVSTDEGMKRLKRFLCSFS